VAELITLARPYAKAIFELASEQARSDSNAFDRWSETLSALSTLVSDPLISAWLGHPAMSGQALSQTLAGALGRAVDPEGVNLLRLLAEYGRLPVLPMVREQYEHLRATAERRIEVEITSAAEIAPAQRTLLSDAIARRLGRTIEVSWKIDFALIGGAVIRAEDTVIDASVAGGLDQLRHALAA
jgi:F-type H+-transporting ATPase subunit delta